MHYFHKKQSQFLKSAKLQLKIYIPKNSWNKMRQKSRIGTEGRTQANAGLTKFKIKQVYPWCT